MVYPQNPDYNDYFGTIFHTPKNPIETWTHSPTSIVILFFFNFFNLNPLSASGAGQDWLGPKPKHKHARLDINSSGWCVERSESES